MDKFDPSKPHTRLDNSSSGWLVQVYSGDHRLLCVLDPSHAWAFLLGCGFGLLLAIIWLNLARYSSAPTCKPATTPPQMLVD